MFTTETVRQHHCGPVAWDDTAVLAAFVEGQERAIATVVQASTATVGKLGDKGRLVHVGGGTSGRVHDSLVADLKVDNAVSAIDFSFDRRECSAREAR